MQVLINVLLGFHVLVSLLMVFIVLMQRPRSEGLGAAFGGGMTENIFGAQTSTVLTKITVWLGSAFFVLTLVLAMLYAKQSSGTTKLAKELSSMPAPAAATPAPAVSPAASPAAPVPGAPVLEVSPTTPVEAAPVEAAPAAAVPAAEAVPAPTAAPAAPAQTEAVTPAVPADAAPAPAASPAAAPAAP